MVKEELNEDPYVANAVTVTVSGDGMELKNAKVEETHDDDEMEEVEEGKREGVVKDGGSLSGSASSGDDCKVPKTK